MILLYYIIFVGNSVSNYLLLLLCYTKRKTFLIGLPRWRIIQNKISDTGYLLSIFSKSTKTPSFVISFH